MEHTKDGAPLEHRAVNTNDIELHVVTAGPVSGPPVLLLHGFPEFWYSWRRQIGPLSKAGYRVIAPDLRGYNLSGRPLSSRAYVPEALRADLIGLLDAFGIEQAAVVGHDWGGVLAWMFAADHPERVARLAILNAPHPVAFRRSLVSDPGQMLRSTYILFFQLPWLPEYLLRAQNFRMLENALVRTSRKGSFNAEDLVRYRQAWGRPGALSGMLAWYRALRRYVMRPLSAEQIRVPTRILWGRQDFALGPALAEASLALCARGELEWFDDAGHWLQHETAERVNERLLDFLRQPASAAMTASL